LRKLCSQGRSWNVLRCQLIRSMYDPQAYPCCTCQPFGPSIGCRYTCLNTVSLLQSQTAKAGPLQIHVSKHQTNQSQQSCEVANSFDICNACLTFHALPLHLLSSPKRLQWQISRILRTAMFSLCSFTLHLTLNTIPT
jgi:hypothetical protein